MNPLNQTSIIGIAFLRNNSGANQPKTAKIVTMMKSYGWVKVDKGIDVSTDAANMYMNQNLETVSTS